MHDRNTPRTILICLALALVTAAIYARTLGYDFVNFDDPLYVTANAHVQSGLTKESVAWAFTASHADNWHPLTWLSHELDCQLWGMRPGRAHLTNLLFHVANTLLLFGVLRKMTGATWRSAIVAGLFAWHPTHVESVAWISERKDVLSTFFWLLTMLAYVGYVQSRKPKVYYGLALVIFALGLMAKPMLVTLPFVLLLLDYWPLERISDFRFPISDLKERRLANVTGVTLVRAALEKIPFLVLAAASSVVTFIVQKKGGAVASLIKVPVGMRFTNALVSYLRYAGKLFWPANLSVLYPMPVSWPLGLVLCAAIFLAGVSALAVWQVKRRPYFFVGWFWFVGTMVPVIGLVQVGVQSMADRYLYVPAIGVFIVVAWGAADLVKAAPLRKALLAPVAAAALAACMIMSFIQVEYWRNSIALFTHATEVTSNNITAEYNLAKELERLGKIDEAIAHYHKALAMQTNPLNPLAETRYNLGTIFARRGQLGDAKIQFEAALRERPDYAEAHINLGGVLWNLGELDAAAEHYRRGLSLQPGNDLALRNLSMILIDLGKYSEAAANFSELGRRFPNQSEFQTWSGFALARTGKSEEAIAHFTRAMQLKPNDVDAYLFWGDVLAGQGRTADARALFAAALRIHPDLSMVLTRTAGGMAAQGRTNMAATFTKLARELNGEFPPRN